MFAGPRVADADHACGGRGARHRAGGGADRSCVIGPCCRSSTPPGFLPFSWPVNDDDMHMDVDMSCFPFNMDCSPDVLHTQLGGAPSLSPLPLVERLFVQDMLWAPVAPQPPVMDDCRSTPVPQWRLARKGPFLAERSPEYIRSFGAGCAFRNTTYCDSDYAAPSGDYGLPMHHPQFIEWIGIPQSAGL